MLHHKTRFWLVLSVLVIFAAGCASTGADNSPSATATQASLPESGSAAEAPSSEGASSVEGSARFVIVPEQSKARYLVTEQLANVSLPSDAVAETSEVSGEIVVNSDGSIATPGGMIEVDLRTLQSDRQMRDNYLRRNVLQTEQFPSATFVPTQVTGLPSTLPTSGEVSFQLAGDLTIRDVTRPVVWDVTAIVNGDLVVALAATSFTFDEFSLTQPSVPVVLSLEDNIRLEMEVTLERAEG